MKTVSLFVVCLFLIGPVTAQQEKVEVDSSEEEMDTVRFSKLLNSYNKVTRVKMEELKIFKIDLLGPLFYGVNELRQAVLPLQSDSVSEEHNIVSIAYEQKINSDFSWTIGTIIQGDLDGFTDIELRGGLRYYYNMKRRILKGKSANNFSANYISASLRGQAQPNEEERHISVGLVYGIQRRLGKRFIFDFNYGIENKDTRLGIGLVGQIMLGIGL